MEKEVLEAALSRLDLWRDLFTLLVVIGVGGEFLVGHWYSVRTKQLQDIQHREDQQQQESMARLHTEAETARTTAESFKLDIAKANERAASAQEQAARFNEIAERERLARVRLEDKLSPRSLTTEQEQSIVRSLRQFTGITVDLIAIGDAAEISGFVRTLRTLLSESGWNVRGAWSTMGGISGTGISVSLPVANADAAAPAANALLESLRSSGIAAGMTDPFPPPNPLPSAMTGPGWESTAPTMRIYVAEKP